MEMFVLSYVSVPQTLSSSWFRKMAQPTWQTGVLYSDVGPLIYVNETICMVICPSKDSSQSFYGLEWIIWCQDYHKMQFTDEGPGAILSFKTFLSFINRLLVTI